MATRLLRDRSATEPGPETVDADEWIDRRDAAGYTVVEDSVRAGSTGMVLSLLWWRDERQILDAADESEDDAERPLTGHLEFRRRGR